MELVYYPDPRLREVSKKILQIDEAIREAVPEMFDIMYRSRGIGLAGPQAGLNRRVVVANLSGDREEKGLEQVFINPEIVERRGEKREEEGCLSLPGMAPLITRAEAVRVRYKTLEGEVVERDAEGLEAKLFQHEIDHLDGILLVDKMTAADKRQWAPLLRELEEEYEAAAKKKPRGKAAR